MRALAIASLIVVSLTVLGQTVADRPAFEVASIKPNVSGDGHSSTHVSNGEVIARNVSLKNCVKMAFHVDDSRLRGPDWLSSVRFDIVAKPPVGSSHDQYRAMMLALLEDRFKLAFHRESKPLAAFALVVAKSGPKLKKGEHDGSHLNTDNNKLDAQGVPMNQFADYLSNRLDRPVVDKTNLEGSYDFKLEWSAEDYRPPAPPDGTNLAQPRSIKEAAAGPSFFTAIQEQLGLKLESAKLPIDIVVVDHVEKVPTEN
jgi:uncharacterized protein (TIGR03435 family)